jgi:hypothetical protein
MSRRITLSFIPLISTPQLPAGWIPLPSLPFAAARPASGRFPPLAEVFDHPWQDGKDDDGDDDQGEIILDHGEISEEITPEDKNADP